MTSQARKDWLRAFDSHLGRYQGTSLETYRDDAEAMALINKMADDLLPIKQAFYIFTRS